ncbi:MAG: hypothetical protein O2960_19435 [Verrucomicrobia bacterium]|nr:hypothetical protein [Verrucomicrobiota bacterium]
MNRPCAVDPSIQFETAGQIAIPPLPRRRFLRGLAATAAGLTCADFLGYFKAYGLPNDPQSDRLSVDAAKANDDPHFLVYWYLEGGWCGYDMFNPVLTDNNVLDRLEKISDERYRVTQWGDTDYGIYKQGNIRYGYLASEGKDLFKDTAVLSSMHTGSGHSSDRLRVHMGDYKFKQTEEREDDERSVMQAFSEVYGQHYVLPNLSWHWWLSDGEINEVQYTGKRGYYHALGPVHAHTLYAGTPAKLKKLLSRMQEETGDTISRRIESFLDSAHSEFLKDENAAAVKSYNSAREIYLQMARRGQTLDRNRIQKLFADPALREEFRIKPDDELITYRSVNGNKARSKFSPNTNVQAMMSYELMREAMSCAFFIESRDVRRFDSHLSRKGLWKNDGTPKGMPDQTQMMKDDLWDPIRAFVARLKNTEYKSTGTSLYDHTQIVITSEFGRSLHGNVDRIQEKDIPDDKKEKEIGDQDICAHWKVTSCAFLGGNVQGDRQYGAAGEKTLMAIPVMADGTLDPNYDPLTGELLPDREKHPESFIPNHGDIYATALYLSGVNPKGRGRNSRPPLKFIKRA